eukprot:3541057-Rhodomonas_salina.2
MGRADITPDSSDVESKKDTPQSTARSSITQARLLLRLRLLPFVAALLPFVAALLPFFLLLPMPRYMVAVLVFLEAVLTWMAALQTTDQEETEEGKQLFGSIRPTSLGICYALSGTNVAYRRRLVLKEGMVLGSRYALSGTDAGYAATRRRRYAEAPARPGGARELVLGPATCYALARKLRYLLRAGDANSAICYALAMRCPVLMLAMWYQAPAVFEARGAG